MCSVSNTAPSVCGDPPADRGAALRGLERCLRCESLLSLDKRNLNHYGGARRLCRLDTENSPQFPNTFSHSADAHAHARAAIPKNPYLFERDAFSEVPHTERNGVGIIENVYAHPLAL